MSGAPGRREVAHRIFAGEYDQASLEYSESDEERAPNYVVTPTGARVNRLFFVGVLTEVESVSDDVLRARIVDPTGAFVVYAGQYQPEAMAFLDNTEPPAFVAVTGKARTFSPDDSDRVFTSVRPESVNAVDADTRDRWTVDAAEQTLRRATTFAAALSLDATGEELRAILAAAGVDASLAAGIPVALEHYGTTEHYLAGISDLATESLRLVADETDQVDVRLPAPDAPGDGAVDFKRLAGAIPGTVVDFSGGDVQNEHRDTAVNSSADAADSSAHVADSSVGSDTAADTSAGEQDDASDSEPPEAAETDEFDDSEPTAPGEDDGSASEEESADSTAESDDVGNFEPAESDDVGDFEAAESDDIGDFEPTGTDETDDIGDFEPTDTGETDGIEIPEEVLDEEERERIEAEYGTEFSTGTEVDAPGEAGIVPESGIDPETGEPLDESEAQTAEPSESESESESEEPTEVTETEDSPEVDLDAVLLETMTELNDGDGANRDVLIAALVEEHDVSVDEVDETIQDALMAGKCFEPADGMLKPI